MTDEVLGQDRANGEAGASFLLLSSRRRMNRLSGLGHFVVIPFLRIDRELLALPRQRRVAGFDLLFAGRNLLSLFHAELFVERTFLEV